MDAYRAIIDKRDTRNFRDAPLAEDVLKRILNAGRMAGSAKNRQPVRLVVLRNKARRDELAQCGDFAQWLPETAVAVAVVLPEGERDLDAGRVAQNLMVAAHAEGLASCPATMHKVECAQKTLGLPDEYRVAIVVGIGFAAPAEGERRSAPRLALDEYVHWERW